MSDRPPVGVGRKGPGFFTYRRQQSRMYRFPVHVLRGHDEYRRATVGLVTWAGSVFYAYPCRDPECVCLNEPNDPYDENGELHA